MTAIVPATAAIEGDVVLSDRHYALAGTDLEYVLAALDAIDPIDVETEDASDAEWSMHNALLYVRDQITIRRAAQAGPDAVGDYCGVSGERGRACGEALGLPDCRYHRVCPTCRHTAETGGQWHFRDHEGGVCPDRGVAQAAEGRDIEI